MLGFELNWWEKNTWILEGINQLAEYNELPRCLDESKNLSVWMFIQITEEENIAELSKYFSESCYDSENQRYLTDISSYYIALFKEYLNENKNIADKKINKITKVSSIWLYSDWILENSGFDLITDIEDIDKIIFADVSEYEWERNEDLEEFIDDLVDWVDFWYPDYYNSDEFFSENDYSNNNYPKIDYLKDSYPEKISFSDNNSPNNYKINSNYVCLDNEENSWLNSENILSLLNNIEKDLNLGENNYPDTNQTWSKDWNPLNWSKTWKQAWEWVDFDQIESDYEKITDNSQWPCSNFFCIDIEMIMYDHKLFWSGEDITIEYLIKRSNEHLSKFASTSLIPAKMTTNQFELWLQNLDLPSIFHLWFQISKKPIPILNIEEESYEDNTEYSSKNLLEKYYKENWLNYQRRNSIVLLENIEQDKQNINNSIWLSVNKVIKNYNEYIEYKSVNNNSSILNKIIEKKATYWITQNFEEQYNELEKFTLWINDYIENLRSIIKWLEKIPIDSA